MATDYRGDNPGTLNPTFATKEQLDYARQMAKYLQSKDNKFHMTPGMAVLPGSWMHGIGPNFIDQLASSDYAQIAGQGDVKARELANGLPLSPNRPTTGDSLTSMVKGFYSKVKGGVSPGTEPGADPKDLTTGSIPPNEPPIEMGQPTPPKVTPKGMDVTNGWDQYLKKLIEIESGGDVNATTGTNRGLGQFGPNEEKKYGINDSNRTDPETQKRAITQLAEDNKKAFKERFGREPTGGELYLMHQQGTTGGQELLANPDKKAAEVIAPYYKSPAIALSAIHGNIPNGHPLKSKAQDLTAKEFSDIWTSRFDKAAALPGQMNAGGPSAPPPMPAGGPGAAMPPGGPVPPPDPAADEAARGMAPMGQQLAQAFGTQGPANNAPPNSNPNPPLLRPKTPGQLFGQSLLAPSEDVGRVIEDHRKELKGEKFKTPFGETLGIPDPTGRGNNQYINQPHVIPGFAIDGISTHLLPVPDGKGGHTMRILVPGGPSSGFESLDSAKDWIRSTKVKDITAEGIAGKQVDHYQTRQQLIEDQAEKSKLHLPQLNIIQRLVKDKSNYVGFGSEKVLDAKKILDAMGMENQNLSQPASMEVLQKLIATSNLAAMEQLRGFGQVRSTDLQWLKESNASMTNRPEAITALADMAKRLHQRSVDIQKESHEYRKEHGGNLDAGWDKHIAQWATDNPLFTDKDIEKYTDKLKEKVKGQPREAEITAPVTTPNTNGPRKYVPGKGWVE